MVRLVFHDAGTFDVNDSSGVYFELKAFSDFVCIFEIFVHLAQNVVLSNLLLCTKFKLHFSFYVLELQTFCTVLVGGMNGSIIYELERAENAGLKGPLKVSSLSLYICFCSDFCLYLQKLLLTSII